jgi:hypothetical protein
MKKMCVFAALYIREGGYTACTKQAFFMPACNIRGFVPPCNSVMGLLPSWCRATGQAEPFLFSAFNKQ